MLEMAYLHKDELERILPKYKCSSEYLYFGTGGYLDLVPKVADSTWSEIYYASLCNGKIVGYLGASVARAPNVVESLSLMAFTKASRTLMSDVVAFIDILHTQGFHSCSFTAVEGGPGIKLYRHAMRSHPELGIREVGTFYGVARGPDGKNRDNTAFQIFWPENIAAGRYIPS